jgi:hypothetical protein
LERRDVGIENICRDKGRINGRETKGDRWVKEIAGRVTKRERQWG